MLQNLDLSGLSSKLTLIQSIDYQALLSELNTPYIYGTLIIGGFFIFLTFASFKRHLFKTSMGGAGLGFIVGILLTLGIQAFIAYKFIGFPKLISTFFPSKDLVSKARSLGPVLGDSISCPDPETSLEAFFNTLNREKSRLLKLGLCQEILKDIK